MALDYSKLSDAELEAIANNDYSKLSDATLQSISESESAPEQPQASPASVAAGMAAPAATGAGMVPGMGLSNVARAGYEVAKDVGSTPIAEHVATYLKNPGKLAADVVTAHYTGVPPLAAKTAYDIGKEYYNKIGNYLGATHPLTSEVETAVQTKLGPVMTQMTKEEFATLANAVQSGNVKSYELPAHLAGNTEAMAGVEALKSLEPSALTKFGRFLAPVARTAARVAGPVGVGMDLYDAGKMARETQLGERLARGEGALAQHAYRQLPSQINTPANPMPGTPQFAQLQAQEYAKYNQQQDAQAQQAIANPTAGNFLERMKYYSKKYAPIMGQ